MIERVFYRLESVSVANRLKMLDEMLPNAHLVTFDKRKIEPREFGRLPIEKETGLQKLHRSQTPIWAFLHEILDDGLVEYELYARFDDPDAPSTEIFMHVRTDEKSGWELKNKYNVKPWRGN